MDQELMVLATEIKTYLDAAVRHHRLSLDAYRAAGELLIQAKKKLYAVNGRKGWTAWIKANPSLPTYQQCQKYMALAKHWHLFADDYDLTLTAALDRIDAANGKTPKNAEAENQPGEEDNKEQATEAPAPVAECNGQPHEHTEDQGDNQPGEEAPQQTGQQTETPVMEVKAHQRGTIRFGNGCYSPRLDGNTWGVQCEADADTVNLLLPLQAEKKELSPRLRLNKAEARHLVKVLSDRL